MSKIITGTVTVGVTLAVNPTIIDGTIVTNAAEAIYGNAAKIWTVANNGYLDAYSGVGIFLRGGAHITNAAHATIFGVKGGLVADGFVTLDNAGFIGSGYDGFDYGPAIDMNGGGAVTNRAGGDIESRYFGIVAYGGRKLTLLNHGVIFGYYDGVAAIGEITNATSGTIIGNYGIVLDGGTINNAGLIEGAISDYYAGAAIYLRGLTDSEIIEQKTGTIIGGIYGFLGGDTIDEAGVTITSVALAGGTLTLYDGAAQLGALTLAGGFLNDEFIVNSDGHGGTDIEIGAATFAGSYPQGAIITALSNTVAAQASLDGIRAGVWRNITLVNHGDIVATSYLWGVTFSTRSRITNTGLIEGAVGIYASGGVIINAGTIDGTQGVAIELAKNTVSTDIILGAGSVLEGGIAGFKAGDTIDLATITATGETFANGILTLTNAGEVVDTIALEGKFKTYLFKLSAAKGGGTDITTTAPAEAFTVTSTQGVTLSATTTITTAAIGSLATASMVFLHPTLWGPSPHAESLPPTPSPATNKPASVAIPLTLGGWLTLDPARGPTVPPITLHAG